MSEAPVKAVADQSRVIWQLTGADVLKFLQGLVTNDVLGLQKAPGMVWTALQTAQGKYLADFFVLRLADAAPGEYLIDIPAPLAADTLRRLAMYKLRADVQIVESSLTVSRGICNPPAGALPDPRDPALGWRFYAGAPLAGAAQIDWEALRVTHMIPEFPNELRPNDSFILEARFEALHGVDFRKGCFVGQEVTARMKHKTELRKGLVRVAIAGAAAPGTPITLPDGREAGVLGTSSGGQALAHLRFDRLREGLIAGTAQISPIQTDPV